MQRFRRWILYLAIGGVAASLWIGFWPVNARVYGDPTYSCGSGFVHNNASQWSNDSERLRNERLANDTAKGTPSQVCPDKVHSRRNWAIVVAIAAIVVGWLALVFTSGPRDRVSRAMSSVHPGEWRG